MELIRSSRGSEVKPKSRNSHSKKASSIVENNAVTENAIIQEGIKVLFQKGKKDLFSKDSSSPFKTIATTKLPIIKGQKLIDQ